MAEAAIQKKQTGGRAAAKAASRTVILDAARRVAARDGAREMSLRGVAAEAGFAPAALYGYFRSKDELLLALAADDLGRLAKVMKEAGGFSGAIAAALALLKGTETIAAASGALTEGGNSEPERLFNGRLIAALKALSDASGLPSDSRQSQCDIVLMAAALSGLAMFSRSGRLSALGFTPEEILGRLDSRFAR
jgi:AcrR family transcriptional regulator